MKVGERERGYKISKTVIKFNPDKEGEKKINNFSKAALENMTPPTHTHTDWDK